MHNKYDVIVIGAGIGGLTAAAILARNGKKVLVLEKNPVVGGYASFFQRQQFRFETSLHLINGGVINDKNLLLLNKCGINNNLTFTKTKSLYYSFFPDFKICVPQENLEQFKYILIEYFPSQKQGIINFFHEMEYIFNDIQAIRISGFPSRRLLKYLNFTLKDTLSEFITDQKLSAIISQLWVFYGSPPSLLSSIYFSYATFDYITNGGYFIEGGSWVLANSLREVIVKKGGNLLINIEVESILFDDNSMTRVITRNGNIYCSKFVISNIDPFKTRSLLIKNLNENQKILDYKNYEVSISAFIVYLGLSPQFQQIIKKTDTHSFFLNPSYDLDQQFVDCKKNNINDTPVLVTIYPDMLDSRKMQKNTTISIITLSDYDYWKGLSKDEYKRRKVEFAKILIKRSESMISNLSSYIEVVEIATPLTLEKYTGNYKGALYGWSQTVSQSIFKRMKQTTNFKNLYLAGAWTQPGGGLLGVMTSGHNAAELILKKE